MNSNKKQKLNFSGKGEIKIINHFYPQLSKLNNNNKNKSNKNYMINKNKKSKEENISLSNNTINNKNRNSNKHITSDENYKAKKIISPKNNTYKADCQKRGLGNILTKKMGNYISISSLTKNNITSEDKNITNNIINKIENNSNIHLGQNNKITIIKNIFNRVSKTKIKEKNKLDKDKKIKIIKVKNKNNYTISGNTKKLKKKKIYNEIRNKFGKKTIVRQSLSEYNSVENIYNENNFLLTKNKKNIFHSNTVSNNLKISHKVKNFRNKLNISLGNSDKKVNMNLSQANFINTYPSLIINNCKSEFKNKLNNIRTIKTLFINSDNTYTKINNKIKKDKLKKKLNLISSINKIISPHLIIKQRISSTNRNNNLNTLNKNHNKYDKNIIDETKLKNKSNIKNNFYRKVRKINLKSVRSQSINVNLVNNKKHKKMNSELSNNYFSSLMNSRMNNKLYVIKNKNKDLSESQYLKSKMSPSFISINSNKELEYIDKGKMVESYNSLNILEESNRNYFYNLKDKIKIINDYYKAKDFANEKNKNKIINQNNILKKCNTNLKKRDINNDSINNNIELEENIIFNNIYQNSLTIYSIYILSKYHNYFDKIGLSQILLFDKNNNIIPVLYSNSNSKNDSSVLFFNNSSKYSRIKNKYFKGSFIRHNKPFISEFKQNLYINFYINSLQSNNIEYIEIVNYYDKKRKISASKDIKIYQGNILLYEGVLNIDKSNIKILNSKINNKKNDSKYLDKYIYSTLSTTSRKNFTLINSNNSNIKTNKKKLEYQFNSPESNKSIKNFKIKFYKNNNDSIRKCLFCGNKSQNELINNKINNNNLNQETNYDYVKFEDIRLVIISNYGHKEYVGLTGIEFIDNKGKKLNIEKAKTIGALPKDLYTIYNDEKEKRIFENIFNGDNNTDDINNMWVTKLIQNNNKIDSIYCHSYIELSFYDKICLSKIKIYNYNDKNNLDICAREIELFFDNEYYGKIFLRQGVGERIFGSIKIKETEYENNYNINEDFSQDITFPLKNFKLDNKYIFTKLRENKFSSLLFNQNYETPYLPCGLIIKFQFNNNYLIHKKKKSLEQYNDIFYKYKVIGLNKIGIYNEKGIDIFNDNNYKIISNCEIINEILKKKNFNNQILLNGAQNENGNNCLFYIFENPIFISYIILYPLKLNENIYSEYSLKDFKIFIDNNIIFEGTMHKDKPSIIIFSSDIKTFNEKFLIQSSKNRNFIEEKNSNYISMSFI